MPRSPDQLQRRSRPIHAQLRDNCLFRRPDWRHRHRLIPPARQLPEQMRRLGRGKSNHCIRRKHDTGRRCSRRIRRPAGRQIDCQHLCLTSLHPLARCQRKPLQRRLEPGAHHRIHHQIRLQRLAVAGELLRRLHHVHCPRPRRSQQFRPGRQPIRREALRRPQQQRRHLQPRTSRARRGQQPCRHHPIPAVVPPPAKNRHPPRTRKLRSSKPGHSSSGGPHQVDRGNPEPLRRRPVASLHLGSRKYVHGIHGSRCQNSTLA